MGGLFGCIGGQKLPDTFIDFDHVEPTEEERQIVDDFHQAILTPSAQLISNLQNYQDAGALIAQAISRASEENVQAAWEAVLPKVHFQVEVYDFAISLTDYFTRLLDFVLNVLNGNDSDILDKYSAITKSFDQCFDIMLKIDEVLLTLPKLLNDLAFFRRTAGRRTDSNEIESLLQKTNEMTIFFGMSNPVLSKTISTLQSHYASDNTRVSQVLGIFGSTVDICASTLINHNLESESSKILALRCITGATLMYDFLSTTGSYTSKTPFAVVKALQQVVNFQPKQNALINTIKYSSKHINDPTTMPQIRELFA